MKRKLVKQGSATLMVSLPSKWVKSNNLGKGSEVDVEELEGNIIIRTDKSKNEKNKAVVNISGFSPLINRILIALYIKGIDELEIKFSKIEEIKDFQKGVINELPGFEIMKQSSESFLVKDITGMWMQDIDEIIGRIFFILDSMAEELIYSLENKSEIQQVIESDSAVNKFVSLCLRNLNKKGYTTFSKTSQVYSIVSNLEEVGDLFKKIAKESKKTKISSQQISILKEIKNQLNLFKDIFFKYEKQKLINFSKKHEYIKSNIKTKNTIDFYLHDVDDTLKKTMGFLLVILPFT